LPRLTVWNSVRGTYIKHTIHQPTPTDQKAELLLRCDELRDALWALCDARAEAAEAERARLAAGGTAGDLVGALAGRYGQLVQVEVDRFVATSQFLQVSACVATVLRVHCIQGNSCMLLLAAGLDRYPTPTDA
jgi:hypothetical protein